MHYEDYYSEIGKLLYALAKSGGIITNTEKEKLHNIVEKEMVPADFQKDQFGTRLAYYTEMEFDFLDEQMTEPEAALESFLGFVEAHYKEWSERMISGCIHLMEELAASFYGTNRKEAALIERIKNKFDQLELEDLRKKLAQKRAES